MTRSAFTLEESARRFGHYRWVEMRLFEVLGGWVSTVPEAEVRVALGTQARKHAWHAELWFDRLPALREMPREALTVPAPGVAGLLEAVAAVEPTIERLVGVHRVLLPHKVAAYAHHLDRASEVADAPTIRALRFILIDEHDDQQQGESLLEHLLRTPAEVDRAAAHQAGLEEVLVAAGGIAGPGTVDPSLSPG